MDQKEAMQGDSEEYHRLLKHFIQKVIRVSFVHTMKEHIIPIGAKLLLMLIGGKRSSRRREGVSCVPEQII